MNSDKCVYQKSYLLNCRGLVFRTIENLILIQESLYRNIKQSSPFVKTGVQEDVQI